MVVERIEIHQQRKSGLSDGLNHAVAGGLVGLASKYFLPLTSQEKDADYEKIISEIKRQATKSENEFLEAIKANPQRSLAQDAYIKSSENFVKRNIFAYDFAVKRIRPTAPFVIAGAVTGLLISFVKNVFSS